MGIISKSNFGEEPHYSSKMSEPMEVYHAQTPVRSMNQSIALFKSHQRAVYDELCKTKPKTFTSFGSNYAKTYTQVSYTY